VGQAASGRVADPEQLQGHVRANDSRSARRRVRPGRSCVAAPDTSLSTEGSSARGHVISTLRLHLHQSVSCNNLALSAANPLTVHAIKQSGLRRRYRSSPGAGVRLRGQLRYAGEPQDLLVSRSPDRGLQDQGQGDGPLGPSRLCLRSGGKAEASSFRYPRRGHVSPRVSFFWLGISGLTISAAAASATRNAAADLNASIGYAQRQMSVWTTISKAAREIYRSSANAKASASTYSGRGSPAGVSF
jgi:hypothetical protein